MYGTKAVTISTKYGFTTTLSKTVLEYLTKGTFSEDHNELTSM